MAVSCGPISGVPADLDVWYGCKLPFDAKRRDSARGNVCFALNSRRWSKLGVKAATDPKETLDSLGADYVG